MGFQEKAAYRVPPSGKSPIGRRGNLPINFIIPLHRPRAPPLRLRYETDATEPGLSDGRGPGPVHRPFGPRPPPHRRGRGRGVPRGDPVRPAVRDGGGVRCAAGRRAAWRPPTWRSAARWACPWVTRAWRPSGPRPGRASTPGPMRSRWSSTSWRCAAACGPTSAARSPPSAAPPTARSSRSSWSAATSRTTRRSGPAEVAVDAGADFLQDLHRLRPGGGHRGRRGPAGAAQRRRRPRSRRPAASAPSRKCLAMLRAGATRIGTSTGAAIIHDFQESRAAGSRDAVVHRY